MKWRADHGIDTICERPYPDYCLMKKWAAHWTYGHSKSGGWVGRRREDVVCLGIFPSSCLRWRTTQPLRSVPPFVACTTCRVQVSWEATGRTDFSAMSKAGFKAEDVEYHVVWSNEVVRQCYDEGV